MSDSFKAFSNKTCDGMINVLNDTVNDIISNLIANETTVCHKRESSCMNKRIKDFMSRNGIFFEK